MMIMKMMTMMMMMIIIIIIIIHIILLFLFPSSTPHPLVYLLILGVGIIVALDHTYTRTRTVAPHWIRDWPFTVTPTWQHITFTTDRQTFPRSDLNPHSQQASSCQDKQRITATVCHHWESCCIVLSIVWFADYLCMTNKHGFFFCFKIKSPRITFSVEYSQVNII